MSLRQVLSVVAAIGLAVALAHRHLPFVFGEAVAPIAGAGSRLASAEASLGQRAFNDPVLSASGRMSCATCHAPETGHAAPNDLAVQWGGVASNQQGLRTSQPLRYLARIGPFGLDAQGKPGGGFFWDGRANSFAEQAAGPLLGPFEMANADKASVVARIARAAWAGQFEALYGRGILNDVDQAFDRLTQALEAYQRADAVFNGYTSKFDAVLRGKATLSEQEARGRALFEDPAKGNCAACHPSSRGHDGSFPLFTDFSYDNLGIPRNPEIAANADPSHFDLGLCARPDLRAREDLCGAFRVPSLRNVAKRKAYFHNGRFKSLTEALAFYVQRDTDPAKWYPKRADGTIARFDDLPAHLHGSVNTTEAPYDRKPGDAPALSGPEIDDVIAFLRTLDDGWQPRRESR